MFSVFSGESHCGLQVQSGSGRCRGNLAEEWTRAVDVCASHRARNPASGRVLANLGLKPEGLLRQPARKPEVFEDVVQTVTGYRSPITKERVKLSQA